MIFLKMIMEAFSFWGFDLSVRYSVILSNCAMLRIASVVDRGVGSGMLGSYDQETHLV
ncbi:hypothetical protein [Pseudovibrio sp. FO-BEG1]|uniref:hypothetical protein n=1 Tax=Pseudovibrio sp. (strain FO-BEG1) TaxID=911045 RepID=UPI0002D30F26|nr:hypothetical protein [Pseudovibrio sp. FO-BEG1]